MTRPRAGTVARVLRDGRVRVPAGAGASAIDVDIFDPAAGTWSRSASGPGSSSGASTLLADGRVLVSGPQTVDDLRTRVYDPAGDTWSWTGPMATYFGADTAVRLADGRVLALGGTAGRPSEVATANVYDPATNAWSAVPDMPDGRESATATLLNDGRALVAGGTNEFACGCTPESFLFAPDRDDWMTAPDMLVGRVANTATRLADGRVLVTGGGIDEIGTIVADTEIFDPATDTWAAGPPMSTPRAGHTATLLGDGRVLVVGGTAHGAVLATTEFYDPAANAWSPGPDMRVPRVRHAAVLLPDGRVLVAGGISRDRKPLAGAEILTLPAPGAREGAVEGPREPSPPPPDESAMPSRSDQPPMNGVTQPLGREGPSAEISRHAVYAQLRADQKTLRGAIRKLRRTGAATMHITLPAAGVERVRLHTTGPRKRTIASGRMSGPIGSARVVLHVTNRGRKALHGDRLPAVRITSRFVGAGLDVTASAPLPRR
jgi:hypothetical protein